MRHTIDASLKFDPSAFKARPAAKFADSLTDAKTDWSKGTATQSLFPVATHLPGAVLHQNLLEYLRICWSTHAGAVLRPDMVWYTLLCEVANIVANNAEAYRHLFANSAEKQMISIQTEELVVMPLDLLAAELLSRTPSDTSMFLPTFSTSTPLSDLAAFAAFADMASPFYNYSMYLCGISSITLEGTVEDWQLMESNWRKISALFPKKRDFFSRAHAVLSKLLIIVASGEDPDGYLAHMFTIKNCGSGHQEEVVGWITHLFVKQPKPAYVQNFSSGVSVVAYRSLSINKDFVLKAGLFTSCWAGSILVPDYGWSVMEKIDPVTTKTGEPGEFKVEVVSTPIAPNPRTLKAKWTIGIVTDTSDLANQ